MTKRFMFVCIGILALTIAFLLGAQFGRAEYVDHSTSGLVAMTGTGALDESGKVWVWLTGYHAWQWYGEQLPVPTSQVKFFLNSDMFISVSNEAWQKGETGSWVNYGPPPGMTATQSSTWGQIKATFKE